MTILIWVILVAVGFMVIDFFVREATVPGSISMVALIFLAPISLLIGIFGGNGYLVVASIVGLIVTWIRNQLNKGGWN